MPYIRQLIKQKQMQGNITIPTSIEDITLRQWQEFQAIEDCSDEKAIEIFCKVSPVEVLNLPTEVYNRAVTAVTEVLSMFNRNQEHIMRFEHNGKQYGMIPNLEKITYGANKDIVATLGDWSKMHYAMNALYRPIVESTGDFYKIQEYRGEETLGELRDMPLHIVLGAQFFFYNLTKALLKATPNYLERELRKELKGTQQTPTQITKENGEAMMKHIVLLKETLEDLMK